MKYKTTSKELKEGYHTIISKVNLIPPGFDFHRAIFNDRTILGICMCQIQIYANSSQNLANESKLHQNEVFFEQNA